MTDYTRRLTMVAYVDAQSMCNDTAASATPDGGNPFDVPLRNVDDDTNEIVAYWCSWQMKDETVDAITGGLTDAGASQDESTVLMAADREAMMATSASRAQVLSGGRGTILGGGQVAPSTPNVRIFDGDESNPDDVLEMLGLDRLISAV